jgi:hypothetical protein
MAVVVAYQRRETARMTVNLEAVVGTTEVLSIGAGAIRILRAETVVKGLPVCLFVACMLLTGCGAGEKAGLASGRSLRSRHEDPSHVPYDNMPTAPQPGGMANEMDEEAAYSPDPAVAGWTDGFENYAVGQWPAPNWQPDGSRDGAIVSEVHRGGSRSLRLRGVVGAYAGTLAHRYTGTSSACVLEFSICNGAEDLPQSGHQWRGCIDVHPEPSYTSRGAQLIYWHKNGEIRSRGGQLLGNYSPLRWYRVKVLYEREQGSMHLKYWIDGDLGGEENLAANENEMQYQYVSLIAQAGTVWYDDVSVSTRTAPSTEDRVPVAQQEEAQQRQTSSSTTQPEERQNEIFPMRSPVEYEGFEYTVVDAGVVTTDEYELFMAAFPDRRNPRDWNYISRQDFTEKYGNEEVNFVAYLLGIRSLGEPTTVDFTDVTSLGDRRARATFDGLGINSDRSWWLLNGSRAPKKVQVGTTRYTFRWCTAPGSSPNVYLVNLGGSDGNGKRSIEIGTLYESRGRGPYVVTRPLDLDRIRSK